MKKIAKYLHKRYNNWLYTYNTNLFHDLVYEFIHKNL